MVSQADRTRSFVAGNLIFAVRVSCDSDRHLLEQLFVDLDEPTSQTSVEIFSMLRTQGSNSAVQLRGPNVGSATGTLISALGALVAAVNLAALDAEPSALHLHAGAVVRNGTALVVVAPRQTGKTTTIAHLVERGWAYVTDETVSLASAARRITGFPKPLSIKPAGVGLVEHLTEAMIPPFSADPDLQATGYRFVPASNSGAAIAQGGEARLAVLLKRDTASPAAVATSREVPPADAVVRMMQEVFDAERHGSAALRLAEFAAGVVCHEVTVGTPQSTAALIETLFENAAAVNHPVELLEPSTQLPDGVVTIRIGDRYVVHHTGSGVIFALDRAGSNIWSELGGWSEPTTDLEGPGVRDFVGQLRALGVVGSTDE